mmetsp:Transcript_32558/g.31038  ORF Transcript_32558/g.31038 Transcript_32558/m.31038 type:complete len:440 (+) Transcript_32558:212-1531(+)
MGDQGTRIKIISKHGFSFNSLLSVEVINDNLCVNWRVHPEKLGVEMVYLKDITMSPISCRILLIFQDSFRLEMEFDDKETCTTLYSCLSSLKLEAHTILEEKEQQQHHSSVVPIAKQLHVLQKADFQAVSTQESLYQLITSLNLKEGQYLFELCIKKKTGRTLKAAFGVWNSYVKETNLVLMKEDKIRWRLHAICNHELDLQAWYHAIFFNEVYRLRGPFWYKDAVLPIYRTSYDIIDNSLTPLEESALAQVLCSPDTVYGDVAGQMFIVQAITTPIQFQLFQNLASQGATVIKYPHSGKPAKKLFRFSFVEGKIYLTWKGKFGNQGVDLGEVHQIQLGLSQFTMNKSSHLNPDFFLSVMCSGRSVDLCFESPEDRNSWCTLLDILRLKEQGILQVESIKPDHKKSIENSREWGFLYEAVGWGIAPLTAVQDIITIKDI